MATRVIIRLLLTAALLWWVYRDTGSFPLLLVLALNAIGFEVVCWWIGLESSQKG